MAAAGSDSVLRAVAARDTVGVARLTHALAVVLAGRTERHAEWSVTHVLATRTVAWPRTLAWTITLLVTWHTKFLRRLVHPVNISVLARVKMYKVYL